MHSKLLRRILTSGVVLSIVDACSRIPGTPGFGSVSFGAGFAFFIVYFIPVLVKIAKVDLSNAGLIEHEDLHFISDNSAKNLP